MCDLDEHVLNRVSNGLLDIISDWTGCPAPWGAAFNYLRYVHVVCM